MGRYGALGNWGSVPTVTKAPPTRVALFMEAREVICTKVTHWPLNAPARKWKA